MATKLKDKLKKATQSATRAANEAARKTAQKTGVREKQNNSTPVRNVQSKTKAKVDKVKAAAKEQNRTPKNKGTSKPVKRVQNIAEQSKYGQKAKADQKKAQRALDKDRYVRDQTARAAVTQDNIAKGRNLPKKSSGVLKEYGMEKYKSGLSPSNLDQTVKAYDLKSKNYGLGKDKVSATDIIDAGTLDPLSQLKADSMSKANFGRWTNPPPSKKKTDKELVQDATKKLKQATHKKGAKQQKTSIYDQSLGKQWENEIKLNKQSWDAADALYNAALRRGDKKAAEKYAKQRDEAHEQAETWRRIKGGFSGGASGDEYIRPKLDMKDKNLLNKEGEKRLAAAVLGYENATTDDERAMYAAMGQSIRNNPKYNLKKGREQRGETYDPGAYREFDANGRMRYAGTKEERKKEQEQTLAIPKTIGYTVAGAFASIPGTTARALREDAYNNQGYLQNLSDIRGGGEVKISEPEKKKTPQERLQELYRDDYFINASPVLKAKKLARVIKEIHDDIPVGQRLLAKGEQYHKIATEGQSGLERYLTEAIIMAGEMAPGLLATGLSGGAAAPGLITMGAQAAGQTMGSLESQGVNPVEAFERGALSGFIEAGTELIPLKHLLKMGKGEGKSFAKELITQLIEEVGTEEASEILGFAVDEYYEKPNLTAEALWNDIQNSLLPSMKDTAAITALTTLGMGTGAGTIGSMRKRVDAQDLTTPTVEDLSKQREALEAEKAQWEVVNARLLDRLQNNTDDPRVHKFFLQELQEHEAKKKELEAKEAGLTMQEMARNEIEAQKQELEQAEQKQGQDTSKPEAIEQPKQELPAPQDQAQPVQQEPRPQQQAGSNPLLDAIGKRFGAEEQQGQTQQQEQPQTNPAEVLQQSAQPQTQEQTQTGKYKPGLDWNDEHVKTFSAKVAHELDTIAKMLGVHIRFANLNEDVDTSDPEAVYNEGYIEDGVITLSRDIKRPVEYVLGHEITHRMQELAPEEYGVLKDYVKGLGKYQDMVDAKIDEYRRGGETLDPEEAWDEITADFAGDIIGSEELMSDFIRGVSHEPTLLQKIKEFFQDLAAKLTGQRKVQVQKAIRMIDNAFGKSAEVIENGEDFEQNTERRDMYAGRKAKNADPFRFTLAEQMEQAGDNTEKVGVEIHEENSSASRRMYSKRTYEQSDYVQDREKAAKVLAKNLKVSVKKAKKYIDDINTIAAKIGEDRLRLDYEPNPYLGKPGKKGFDSSLVSNAEYGGSIDFSTICKKRRLYTGTIEAIQKAFPNKALTADEMLTIRNMMKERGYEVACGMCYVEGSRAKFGEYAQQFIDELKKEDASRIPNIAEINTIDGLKKIRAEEPELYKKYTDFINSLSQRKPKLFMSDTEYNGEILAFEGKKDKKTGESMIQKYNDNGGFRLQSFSDFEIIHLIDAMQVIMDMSRVGLKGQAYTKVADFAKALGNTGLKINLSMVAKGLDENGRLVFDEVEGMKESEALELRDKHPDNVGTVVVCFTADQIRAALMDDRIDFVLPFHHSQWSAEQFEAMGLPEGTRSFQSFQNDYPKEGKKENLKPLTFWNFNKDGRWNAERYLKICHKEGRTPKFAKLHGKDYLLIKNKDGSYSLPDGPIGDNYWKLLIDVKMYNHLTGKGAKPKVVSPEFDMEEANRMLEDYTGGHETLPVAQDIVDEFTEMENTKAHLRNGGQLGAGGTISSGPRFSKRKRDADYKKAVDEGDMATAQHIVDEAAMEAGYTIKGFHGTDANFNEFKLGDIGYHIGTRAQANDRIKQAGLRSTQAGRNPHVLNLYAKIENPLVIDRDFGDWHGKNVAEMLLETEQWEEGYDENAEEINARLREIADMPDGTFTDTTLRNYLKSLGYDGIEYQNQFEDIDEDAPVDSYDTSYIAFDSSQLKRFDPVIRDDNGEIIPPSERFNPKKKDIRFSKRMIQDYRDAAKNKDAKTASKIVREAAAMAGYTVPVYHGTQKFGFTKPRGDVGDDEISFFVTKDLGTARTYSNSEGVRPIKDNNREKGARWNEEVDRVTDEMMNAVVTFGKIAEEASTNAGIPSVFKPIRMVRNIVDDIEDVKNLDDAEGVVDDYFDALTEQLYNKLATEEQKEQYDDPEDWLEFTMPDQFREEFDKARTASYAYARAVWAPDTDGNYSLFLNPEGLLEVEGEGALWHSINFEPVGEKASTRDIARWAYDNGYPGVHFKEIVDDGGKGIKRSGSADVYAIFSPEYQTKSADPFTYDDKGNLIPLEERFDPNNPDWRWSKRKLGDNSMHESIYGKKKLPRRKKKRPERTESDRQGPYSVGAAPSGFDRFSQWQNQSSSFHPINPMAEGAEDINWGRAPVEIPTQDPYGYLTSKTASTFANAGMTPNQVSDELANMAADGRLSRIPFKDKTAVAHAEKVVQDKGYQRAKELWQRDMDHGNMGKNVTVMGITLYNAAANSGHITEAIDIATDMIGYAKTVAQSLQAVNIINKLGPTGKLYSLTRSIEKLEEQIRRKKKLDPEHWSGITIPEDLAKAYMDAKTLEEQREIEVEIKKAIAKQIPNTLKDKFDAWRYTAMLGNPRTQVRNILGNMGFQPLRITKNAIGAGLERMAGIDQSQRTKAVQFKAFSKDDKARYQAGLDEYEDVQDIIMGNGKFNDDFSDIDQYRTIFKFKPFEKWRELTNWGLEKGDIFFAKRTYADSLAGVLKARGITAEQYQSPGFDQHEKEAIQAIAIEEAQKATYRDLNQFSKYVAGLGKRQDTAAEKVAHYLTEGLLPFKKTPANILVRGLEYSPLGLIKGVVDMGTKVKNGEITAAQGIDEIASGLTGTGMLALGIALGLSGVVSPGDDEDDKQNKFNELIGKQSYALKLPGGYSFTLDWLAPESIPFFMGVELQNAAREVEEGSAGSDLAWNALRRMADPVLEQSMLQGVTDMLENVSYADNKAASILTTLATGYLSQFVPTIGGQLERTLEDRRYSTWIDRNSKIPSEIQYLLAKNLNKIPIPGVEYNQRERLNAWGEPEMTGNLAVRALTNFLSPGYLKKETGGEVEAELQRLYDLGFDNVFPTIEKTTSKINGEPVSMEQFQLLQASKGQLAKELYSDAIGSAEYEALSDADKADYLSNLQNYAKTMGRQAAGEDPSKVPQWMQRLNQAAEDHDVGVSALLRASMTINGKYDADGNGSVKTEEAFAGVQDMAKNGLSESEQRAIFDMYNGTEKTYDEYKAEADKKAEIQANSDKYISTLPQDMQTSLMEAADGKLGGLSQADAYDAIMNLGGTYEQQKAAYEGIQAARGDNFWKDKGKPRSFDSFMKAQKKASEKREKTKSAWGDAPQEHVDAFKEALAANKQSYHGFFDACTQSGIPRSEWPSAYAEAQNSRTNKFSKNFEQAYYHVYGEKWKG